jgi:hypothetical protein
MRYNKSHPRLQDLCQSNKLKLPQAYRLKVMDRESASAMLNASCGVYPTLYSFRNLIILLILRFILNSFRNSGLLYAAAGHRINH